MKRLHVFSLNLICVVCLISAAGCVPLVIGAAAGAGGVAYARGGLIQNMDENVETVNKAAVSALGDLGYYVTSDELNVRTSHIRAEDKEGRAVVVNIEALTEYVSKLTIRVGAFGDEDESLSILDAIERKL